MRAWARTATVVAVAALWAAPVTHAEKDEAGFVRVAPEEVQWKDLPGYGGLKYAVIEGDPSKEGIYVVRVKFPPGLMTRPHYHPEDRHATDADRTRRQAARLRHAIRRASARRSRAARSAC